MFVYRCNAKGPYIDKIEHIRGNTFTIWKTKYMLFSKVAEIAYIFTVILNVGVFFTDLIQYLIKGVTKSKRPNINMLIF